MLIILLNLVMLLGSMGPCEKLIDKPFLGHHDQYLICAKVGWEADLQGVDRKLAMTLAWSESRFHEHALSTEGAYGPLQVTKWWWKPGEDPIEKGIIALKHCIERTGRGDPLRGLCHYAEGNICTEKGRKYAQYLLSVSRKL